MTKKYIFNPENPEGILVDMTAEEQEQYDTEAVKAQADKEAEENAKAEKENLKASARAKLVAGEPLTQEEADTIVL